MWFLNGRPLRDKILSRVLRDSGRGFIVDNKQPAAFLALALDPSKVDVNVHPAKAEVRFRDERRMFGFLVAPLRAALQGTDMATPGERMLTTALAREGGTDRDGFTLRPSARQFPLPDTGVLRAEAGLAEFVREVPAAPARSNEGAAPLEIRGPLLQIAKTYIVRALPDGFEIVDQHALHERLTLELLSAELARGNVEVQRRLVPELVEVGAAQAELLEAHLEALARIGIQLARFGAGTIAVHGLPSRLRKPDPEAIVREILGAIERTGAAPGAAELLEEVLHRAACRSSVMAGDELGEIEMRALLSRARETNHDQTCAHGRPTRVKFTLADLERAFQRR
jgi:DNA mismatch repair protein MutL